MYELNKSPGRWPLDTKVLVGRDQGRWALVVEAPLRDERSLPLRSATYDRLQQLAHALYRSDPDEPLCGLPHSLIVSLFKEANISPATRGKAGYPADPVSRPEFVGCLCGWDQARHTFWLSLFEHRADPHPSYLSLVGFFETKDSPKQRAVV
jgi:hypothetical protein